MTSAIETAIESAGKNDVYAITDAFKPERAKKIGFREERTSVRFRMSY